MLEYIKIDEHEVYDLHWFKNRDTCLDKEFVSKCLKDKLITFSKKTTYVENKLDDLLYIKKENIEIKKYRNFNIVTVTCNWTW
jgi:hypothetical protein